MYTAEYMADANQVALPPIGDHANDWHWLLDRAGALGSAEEIGLVLHLLASIATVSAAWWMIRLEVAAGAR